VTFKYRNLLLCSAKPVGRITHLRYLNHKAAPDALLSRTSLGLETGLLSPDGKAFVFGASGTR
jgi:hypothetical protein